MATIRKLGTGLAVEIPAALADQLGISAGTAVEIAAQNGSIVVTPLKRPKYSLREMLKQSKRQHFQGELEWGPDVGKEVID